MDEFRIGIIVAYQRVQFRLGVLGLGEFVGVRIPGAPAADLCDEHVKIRIVPVQLFGVGLGLFDAIEDASYFEAAHGRLKRMCGGE